MNEPCVFCEITAGRAPATVLTQSKAAMAIVPLNPVVDGHFIVLPKSHVADACEHPYTAADTMFDAAVFAREFLRQGDERYRSVNFITSVGRPATQSIFHLHIHVVPRAENDGLALPWYTGKRKTRA